MKLKLDAAGHVVVQDGHAVYTNDKGEDVPFDAAGALAKITSLNGEAMARRKDLEAAQAQLKAFEGLDPEKARDAIGKLSAIDQKKLVDAGEIEKVRAEIKQAVEASYQPIVEKAASLEQALHSELIGGAFARSAFIKDKVAIPPDFVQSYFGRHMKVEDGKLVAYDEAGQKIYSKDPNKVGSLADFDEALSVLVSSHPHRDAILKANGANGTNGKPSAPSNPGGKTMTRAQFDALSQADRAAKVKDGFKVVE